MIEKKEINVAKQLDDVMNLLVELVKLVKAKGDYTELIDELIAAITGMDEIDDEFKADKIAAINTVLLRATEIAGVFLDSAEKAE